MAFNSYEFILLFLPVTFIGYFLFGQLKTQLYSKIFLLLMSFLFVGYSNINYLLVLLVSITMNYVFTKQITKAENHKQKKVFLIIDLILNVMLLFYFKYFNFFLETMNLVFRTSLSSLEILLPIGISFYTFQQISYVIDVYREKVPSASLLNYALFASFFPDIVSGPIILHGSVIPQFDDETRHHFQYENFNRGLYLFALGIGKKVLIADVLGKVVNAGYADVYAIGPLVTIFVIFAYTLQLYFDFSGYSDMARGIARMLNIEIPINFNSPYKAINIKDFWRRWHITLTQWLTNYIYIPLGGSRNGKMHTYVNIMIVFLISGLWHGAYYTFVFWGLLHGLGSCVYRVGKKHFDQFPNWLNQCITFIYVSMAWIIFRVPYVTYGIQILKNMIDFDRFTAGSAILKEILPTGISNSASISTFINTNVLWIAYLILGVLLYIVFRFPNSNEMQESFQPNKKYAIFTAVIIICSILSFSGVGTFIYSNF